MKFKWTAVLMICVFFAYCASSPKNIQKKQANDPKYQYNLGLFHLNAGSPDRAIASLNRSNKLKPGNYLVHHSLGLAHSMKGELEKSVAYFQTALKINPESTETRNALGIIYQEMGFLDKAEDEFQGAIADKNYTSRALPHYNLARLYQTQNKLDEAVLHLESALALDNSFVLALNLKGIILENLKRLPEAIDSYTKALNVLERSRSDSTQIQFNLAAALFKNNEYIAAKKIFEEIYTKVTDIEMKKDIDKYLKMIK